jgi:hypothetical protein
MIKVIHIHQMNQKMSINTDKMKEGIKIGEIH